MNNYVINDNTLAILPYGEKSSIIYEVDNKQVINITPNNILKRNCELHGSSYDGRLIGTKMLTGYSYKAPIIIEEKNNIIFFPTSSPRLKRVSWINLSNVNNCYYDDLKNACIIRFNNGSEVEIDTSVTILNNQILRASRLELKLLKNRAV